MLIRTGADEIERAPILSRTLVHQAHHLLFVQPGGNAGQRTHAQLGGDFLEQRLDVARADRGEHFRDVGFGVWNEWHPISSMLRSDSC